MRGVAVRTLNVRLAVVLFFAAVTLVVGIHYLHRYQMWRNAYVYRDASQRAVERAKKAGSDNDKLQEDEAYREALRNYRLYLRSRPDDNAAQEEFALLSADRARDMRSLVRAFGLLERVLQQTPDHTAVRRRLIDLAMTLHRYQDAKEHLESVLLKQSPDDPSLLSLYGQCQAEMGDHAQAVETFKKAIEHGPDQVDVYPRLATELRFRFSRPKEADQWMESLVAANPKSAKAHSLRGAYLSNAGLSDDALSEALQSLQLAPDDRDSLRLAAQCSIVKGETALARQYAERGIELYPDNVAMYVALADVEMQAQNQDKALEVLEKGLKVTNRNPFLLDSLAQALIDVRQLERAKEILKELRKVPRYPNENVVYIEARIDFVEGHWLAARQGFERIRGTLAMTPALLKQVDTWIGKCYGAVGDYEQQIQVCRRALAIDPFYPPARADMIDALRASGHMDEALDEYARLARLGRMSFEGALEFVRMMTVNTLRQDQADRNWEPVEKALEQVEQMRPDSPKTMIVRSEILVGMSRIADAQRMLQEACDKNPDQSDLLTTLASLAVRQQDWDEVERILEKLQKLQGDTVEQRLSQAQYLVARYGKDAAERLQKLAEDTGEFSSPQLVRLWNGLLGAAMQIDDGAQSKLLCRRIADKEPSNVQIRYLLFEQGMQTKDDDGMDRALAEIEKIAGQTAYWSYGQAVRLSEQAKGRKDANELLDQALAYLAKARKLRQSWTRIPLLAGEFYYRQGKWNEALKNYQEAIDAGERNPVAIQKTVRLLFQQQRYADAYQLLRRLENPQMPFSPELNRRGAESALLQGEFDRALDMARKAASQDSKDYQDHLWLGQVLGVLGSRASTDGQAAQAEQLLSEAETALRHAVELEPHASETWVALIQFLCANKKADQAAEAVADAAAKIAPEHAPLALAQCYEAIGDQSAAQKQCEIALSAAPQDSTVVRFVANFYAAAGKSELAEALLKKIADGTVETSDADVIWARRQLALSLFSRGPYANVLKARELLDKNLAVDERSLPDRRAMASLDARDPNRARHDEAIRILEGILREQSATSQDRFALAQLYLAIGSWTKANAQFRSLLISYGNETAFLTAYIAALLQHGEIANAEVYLDRLEKLAPNELSTVAFRAAVLALKNELDRALGLLNGFVDKPGAHPADPNERLRRVAEEIEQLGLRLTKPGQEAMAEQCARRARVLFESYVDANPRQALALVAFLGRQGDMDAALKLLEANRVADARALAQVCSLLLSGDKADKEQLQRLDRILQGGFDLGDRPVPLLLTQAVLRTRQARYADAEALYRESLGKESNVSAMNNLAVLLALQGVKLEESLKLINQAIEIAGPIPAMLDSRASVHTAMGHPKEAIVDLEEAIANVESPVWLFHQARAYEESGQRTTAVAVMRKAMKKGLAPSMLEVLEVPTFEKLRDL
jgi:cellulose synthase operon protein C